MLLRIRSALARADREICRYLGGGGALGDTGAETYVGEAVKILIAVVIGALLLTLTYTLMKTTVFATVTKKVKELFNFVQTPEV